MALETLSLSVAVDAPLPASIQQLLERSRDHELAFQEGLTFQPSGGYLAGDHELAFHGLQALWVSKFLRGPCLCEWGSGLGVVALMAAWQGFEATGIEIQEALVSHAEALATECGLAARFVCGSFVPAHVAWQPGEVKHLGFLENEGADGHALLDLDPSVVDVVYVYPWPGDEPLVTGLFDHIATAGAVLVTDTGEGALTFRRKA